MREIRCRRCDQILTSPRSRKKGIGIICDRLERGLPARAVGSERPLINNVPFSDNKAGQSKTYYDPAMDFQSRWDEK